MSQVVSVSFIAVDYKSSGGGLNLDVITAVAALSDILPQAVREVSLTDLHLLFGVANIGQVMKFTVG